MATKTKSIDWGGLTLYVNELVIGETAPNSGDGSTLSGTELAYLDAVTAGTGAASKAVVLDASGDVTLPGDVTGDGTGTMTGFLEDYVADGTNVALTLADSGKTVIMDSGAACAVTLPDATAAAVGARYDFLVRVTTHASTTITCDEGDFFNGSILIFPQDTDAVPTVTTGDGAADDVLTLNGTTTGGIVGTMITIRCVAAGIWTVSGYAMGSGSLTDAFSAP